MKTIPISCGHCSIVFNIQTKEYNRQIKNGRQYFFCSLSCSASRIIHTEIESNCLFCDKRFETTTHKHAPKCCSLDCAHKYAQSFVNTTQISKSLREYNTLHPRQRQYPLSKSFTCFTCACIFTKNIKYNSETYKTCSKKCYSQLRRKLARENPNCGGDTNYKKYNYKGIWMDSKWEVELAKWMDGRHIKWERSKKNHQFIWTDINGNKRRYYPDFYLPDYVVYLDPKNQYLKSVDEYKLTRVIQENKIRLIWGLLDDVKKEVDILRTSDIVITDATKLAGNSSP